MKLSALVVARNEEARLPDCLISLAFADEILVVLDRTTDGSAEIGRAAGARVLEGAWAMEGARRNAGIEACTGEWILEVDADERVSPELATAVRETIATSPFAWHQVPKDNYVGERLIRFGWAGSFGTTSVPGLFRKGAKRWRMQRVHPGLDWTGTQGPKITRGALVHLVDRDITDMLRRLDSYSTAKARDLIAAGDIGTLRGNVRRFFSRAWKSYVGRRGYREGAWGVLLAFCTGAFPLLSYLKARLEPEKHRE
ncbi:glycosyltransferase family 2 protein [Plastoroseomonas arctica]|uniref:Glycosyltransferase family 2 protein n=1 Tax=Plastoroseomonas arctica TaxID=1509237 RepID=A0AAF1JW04_9PROT|nr:glycosyltransferase family 2 protein [Plastoroseomonas arctica]MBR0654377.1 glycosyltransferase family 2 protein [Plastoroseomonas arctica]